MLHSRAYSNVQCLTLGLKSFLLYSRQKDNFSQKVCFRDSNQDHPLKTNTMRTKVVAPDQKEVHLLLVRWPRWSRPCCRRPSRPSRTPAAESGKSQAGAGTPQCRCSSKWSQECRHPVRKCGHFKGYKQISLKFTFSENGWGTNSPKKARSELSQIFGSELFYYWEISLNWPVSLFANWRWA